MAKVYLKREFCMRKEEEIRRSWTASGKSRARKKAQDGSHKAQTGSEMAAMPRWGKVQQVALQRPSCLKLSACFYAEPSNSH